MLSLSVLRIIILTVTCHIFLIYGNKDSHEEYLLYHGLDGQTDHGRCELTVAMVGVRGRWAAWEPRPSKSQVTSFCLYSVMYFVMGRSNGAVVKRLGKAG